MVPVQDIVHELCRTAKKCVVEGKSGQDKPLGCDTSDQTDHRTQTVRNRISKPKT